MFDEIGANQIFLFTNLVCMGNFITGIANQHQVLMNIFHFVAIV
jgi:hypothetical protein